MQPFPVRVCGRTVCEKPNSHDLHASGCELRCRPSFLHSSHICKWRTSLEELFRGPSRGMLCPQSNHGCLLRYWQRPHKVTEDKRVTNFALQETWPWHVSLPSVGSGFYRVSKINTIENILCMKWQRVANMWNVFMWQLPALRFYHYVDIDLSLLKVFFRASVEKRRHQAKPAEFIY